MQDGFVDKLRGFLSQNKLKTLGSYRLPPGLSAVLFVFSMKRCDKCIHALALSGMSEICFWGLAWIY